MLIPIAFFVMVAAIVILPRYFKSQERLRMSETLRAAIEKGQPLPSEIIDAMSTNVRLPDLPATPQRDLRTGIIWMGVAAGLVALGLIVGFEEPEATYWFIGMAAFPGFIGLAFVVLGLLNRKKG